MSHFSSSFYSRNSLGHISNRGKVHSSGLLNKRDGGGVSMFYHLNHSGHPSSQCINVIFPSRMAQCESTEWPVTF